MTGPVDIEEGRRLLAAERAMDEGERWSISTSQMDLLAWSRNNLPALLDEAEKAEALAEEVPTLEAEVERLQAENADRDAYDRANLTAVAATVAHKDAEIARLRSEAADQAAENVRLREALRKIERLADEHNEPWIYQAANVALAVVEEPT